MFVNPDLAAVLSFGITALIQMIALAAAVADGRSAFVRLFSTHNTDHQFSHGCSSSSLCQLSDELHFVLARCYASVEPSG
ncbi:MAG: hypothetical protein J4N98_01920, partial [Chloroflexi bacterium]|nr:hypothetical protein [Chloroflexota bacterium]